MNHACLYLWAECVTAGSEPITENSPDYPSFRDALVHTTADLAKRLVRDGEGATKFVTVRVQVRGWPTCACWG